MKIQDLIVSAVGVTIMSDFESVLVSITFDHDFNISLHYIKEENGG